MTIKTDSLMQLVLLMHETCSSKIPFLLASLFSKSFSYLITFKVVPWLQLFISWGGFHESQLAGGKPARCLYKGG